MTISHGATWSFADSGGDAQGFNEGAIDIFQGHGLQSLIREVIQNSSDARDSSNQPVEVAFSVFSVNPQDSMVFHQLSPWLQRAWDADPPRPGQDDDLAQERHGFYRRALQQLSPGMSVQVLAVHDFNTTGLRGPTNYTKAPGPWWKLVRSTGSSLKTNAGAAGSFGHGSKAPFAFSGARAVFYYTHFEENGASVQRFQGKSILESMQSPNDADTFTSNTGYFGTGEAKSPEPITGSGVPQWLAADREKFGEGYGTSIAIVLPQLHSIDDFWENSKVAVTTNFAPAVMEDRIRVHLGSGESINSDTIRAVFREIDRTKLDDLPKIRLESAETVLFGLHEAKIFDGFGEVDLFWRTGDGISTRKVGIARSAGMLITRDAENLKGQFGSTEPFDLFVWVRPGPGNVLLRNLENPAHDAFEFDRIKDSAKQKEAKKKYQAFTKALRNEISERFGVKVEEHLALNDLDFLLSDESLGNEGKPEAQGGEKPAVSPLQKPVSPSGAQKNKKKPVAVAIYRGGKPPVGREGALDAEGTDVERNEAFAENFRVVPAKGGTAKAVIYIDAPSPEFRYLEIYRSGETAISDEPCFIRTGSAPSFSHHLALSDGKRPKRIKIEVTFKNVSDLHGGSRLIGVVR